MSLKTTVTTELHVSRQARDRYNMTASHFADDGRAVFDDVRSVRVFAQEINAKRDLSGDPPKEQAIKAGQLNAMALMDAVLSYVAYQYRRQLNPDVLKAALQWLAGQIGQEALDSALARFVDEFPPPAVYERRMTAADYLAGETEGVSHRETVLGDMLQVWLDNANAAASSFKELFDDANLEKESPYLRIIYLLRRYLDTQPRFGPDNENLVDLLRSPAVAVPLSLAGQLQYIREKWAFLLGDLLEQLLGGLDLLAEEEKMVFAGPGPTQVWDFSGLDVDHELARYSADRGWMRRLVIVAKSTYVWLDQLAKIYQRPIYHLDHIPDEELDTLAQWGFSGLWLIGLWERSQASQRIKQIMGNPEAVASAYSLFDYQIAADLGGEEAYRNLAGRAWQRGIRLASDMVPNHMGLDSKWVLDHPDWFIGLDYSPFPSYSFNGPDLSSDGRVGIFLEDHYYNHSDAAVVFKRVDRTAGAGSTRYIYHGNDGTTMPWNDTAQLDYLNPTVREAVIQTILDVARRFPVIRFDAAMTLAKRHIQRLWFPQPGTGGAIASRSEHGMPQDQFDAAMPTEFWREVVERVAQEVPDTLLLAEAFWMMEGYFVRTLGMHRVYNSAFMHMLKAEENAKYRSSIKNVLEFDAEILKRYVNFMNNPDEETAVAQFGKDDKYFGVCTMMVTMPGLPMIGHGQVEGYREKYGMEYRRAYWDEQPDMDLVRRHEREIFPLMQRRHVFAGVQNFWLYDFTTDDPGTGAGGHVNEDVFAYSNSAQSEDGPGERGLVLYNNKYADARGWIRTSASRAVQTAGGERQLVQKTLGEALGLHTDDGLFCIYRDHVAGLEFLRSSRELCDQGMYAELGAFRYLVYLDFREVVDDAEGHYAQLAASLGGRGVPSIAEALQAMLQPPEEPEVVAVEPEPELFPRGSGLLLHLTSLPGRFGIGDMGDAAYRFVDFLAESNQRYWQIMPLGPTSYGDSPYQGLSALAGNPLLISLDRLVELRCLASWDLDTAPNFPESRVDFGPVIGWKQRMLRLSHDNFKMNASEGLKGELDAFCAANAWWLDDYALFAALKEHYGGASWSGWEQDIATHQPAALERWQEELSEQIEYHRYVQFMFNRQWTSLKAYANERGISIMGDVPIFVSYDSADAWAHAELFHFDAQGKPTLVAGVPPDYFSPTGQLWGNPLYAWDAMASDGYAWWIDRFKRAFEQVDAVRLDHFRGFEACWAVPAGEVTAINGEWLKSPGSELFRAVEAALGRVRFIAEDLGLITPEVKALLAECGFPGMKVLQFAFSGDPDNLYLPHNYDRNSLVCTGTHDNDTTVGWLNGASEQERAHLRRYLAGSCEEWNWAIIRLALMSVAQIAIVPLQDILGVGSEGRMNTPGRADGNWGWRFALGMLTPELGSRLKELTEVSGRAPQDESHD